MARIENVNIDGTDYDVGKIATTSSLGVVQVGSGLSITNAGVLSADSGNNFLEITFEYDHDDMYYSHDGTNTSETVDGQWYGATYSQVIAAVNNGQPVKATIVDTNTTDTYPTQYYYLYNGMLGTEVSPGVFSHVNIGAAWAYDAWIQAVSLIVGDEIIVQGEPFRQATFSITSAPNQVPVFSLRTTDPGEGVSLATNNFIGVYE